jgi:uncharacterized membrane protein
MRDSIVVTLALTLISVTPLLAAQGVPASGTNLGSVTGGSFKEAHLVIDKKCTSCHSAKRIEQALSAGKNMQEIQHRMELKGVKMTSNEHSVLGIFWKETPLKKQQP